MIYLVIYLAIGIVFAGLFGAEMGAPSHAIIGGFLWPLTFLWLLTMLFLGQR